MRHNKWNKCLKIACSWILIFSMCFLSLNTVNASAEDTTAFESESETGDTEAFTSDTSRCHRMQQLLQVLRHDRLAPRLGDSAIQAMAQERTVENRPYTDLRPFHFGVDESIPPGT